MTLCLAESLGAAIQQARLQRYNAGRTKGTNEAVAMALDSHGNLVVRGSSRGTLGDFDYVTVKYSPAGSNLWVRRDTSPGGRDDQIRALACDPNGDVVVTGYLASARLILGLITLSDGVADGLVRKAGLSVESALGLARIWDRPGLWSLAARRKSLH